MGNLMQTTKKIVALGAFILLTVTAQIGLLAIAFFPLITYWGILNDPEAPEK